MTILTNLSIRARLVLSVLIAMAAGLAVTVVVLTARISEVVEAQALREAQALAENQASEIEGQLASALQVARGLAQTLR
ncbi:MAG: hypothetical protein K2Q10_05140, partial [Rhodospirillales bacterium]|nr:hypothetical protein [Rhodospirillales bacterium]